MSAKTMTCSSLLAEGKELLTIILNALTKYTNNSIQFLSNSRSYVCVFSAPPIYRCCLYVCLWCSSTEGKDHSHRTLKKSEALGTVVMYITIFGFQNLPNHRLRSDSKA